MKKAEFNQLYYHCQNLEPKVKRNNVINKIVEITGSEKIQTIMVVLDTAVLRGFFLSASNEEHPLVKKVGRNVIVLAKDMNECWDRFINVKEAMHLMDDDDEVTDSIQKFETLLDEWGDWSSAELEPKPQKTSDVIAMWMALTCLCPEKNRQEFKKLLDKKQIDHYGIALKLKIPQFFVPVLFRSEYELFLETYIG